jgi:hypothetical protein
MLQLRIQQDGWAEGKVYTDDSTTQNRQDIMDSIPTKGRVVIGDE